MNQQTFERAERILSRLELIAARRDTVQSDGFLSSVAAQALGIYEERPNIAILNEFRSQCLRYLDLEDANLRAEFDSL